MKTYNNEECFTKNDFIYIKKINQKKYWFFNKNPFNVYNRLKQHRNFQNLRDGLNKPKWYF